MHPLVHATSLDTRTTEGPIKSLLSVCLSVNSAIFSETGDQIFLIFGTMIDSWNV